MAPGPVAVILIRTQFRVLAATIAPEFCKSNSLEERGHRECRVPDAPAALCAKVESTQVSHHRFAETIRHSLRDGFNGFLRALPGDRLDATVIPEKLASQELDASIEASGPHDFAVRKIRALVSNAAYVHRILSRRP